VRTRGSAFVLGRGSDPAPSAPGQPAPPPPSPSPSPSPPREARGGEGQGQRFVRVTCPRSACPCPAAARAGGSSGQADGLLVAVARRRARRDSTLESWIRWPAGPGQQLASAPPHVSTSSPRPRKNPFRAAPPSRPSRGLEESPSRDAGRSNRVSHPWAPQLRRVAFRERRKTEGRGRGTEDRGGGGGGERASLR
jgi:hypothetical protein